MRKRDWFLIVSAAVVYAPRIIDSYMGLHGGQVSWDAWPLVHGLSGLGMACIGAWAVAECVHALAVGKRGATWNLLTAMTVAMLLALGLQVLPPIAGVQVEGATRVAWAIAAVASPLLVVAAMPVANALADAPVLNAEAPNSDIDWQHALDSLEQRVAAQIASAHVQAVQVNVATHATRDLPMATSEVADLPFALARLPDQVAEVAGQVADLPGRLQELQGELLVDVIPQLTKEGFGKARSAEALGKPLYALSPSKLKKQRVGEV